MTAPRWRFGDDLTALEQTLARGGILAVPTESSYGLAVDPESKVGVGRLYAMKERAAGKPLPVVVADLDQAARLGVRVETPLLQRLSALWPAPLTLVVPCRPGLPAAAGSAGLAIRIPAHRGLWELLAALGRGLTATSANLSGEPPLLDPAAVGELLSDREAWVVDGGVLAGGLPSTVVDCQFGEARLLRNGSYPFTEVLAAV